MISSTHLQSTLIYCVVFYVILRDFIIGIYLTDDISISSVPPAPLPPPYPLTLFYFFIFTLHFTIRHTFNSVVFLSLSLYQYALKMLFKSLQINSRRYIFTKKKNVNGNTAAHTRTMNLLYIVDICDSVCVWNLCISSRLQIFQITCYLHRDTINIAERGASRQPLFPSLFDCVCVCLCYKTANAYQIYERIYYPLHMY